MRLTIDRLGYLGDGIGPGPIYAARTLPGEEIEGDVAGDRIAAPRILTPSPDRIRPPCPHYKSCGGCGLMHARDGFVTDWKIGVVRDALAAHGMPAPIRTVTTSPPNTRRRATLSGRRLKSGPVVGFHARASDTVMAVPDCHLLAPQLRAAVPAAEALTAGYGSRKGEMRFAIMASSTGIDLDASGGRDLTGQDHADLAGLAAQHDLARLSYGGEVIVARRAPELFFDGLALTPPPGAFLQATESGELALRTAVTDAVGPARLLADLFAGCGTFALPLARQTATDAYEGEASLLAALDQAWRDATGIKQIRTFRRDLFRNPIIAEDLAAYDAVVIDPPRAGAEAQTRELAKAGTARIAAVSCNPVTFARDARILIEAGFALDWIDVVDQFRWSPHVELAAAFRAPHIGG